ncbi:MAG: hypothetical protein VR75_11740 [Hyphomonadaceae bacterium BRH_c29]|nr:MAG: hypothetical protein VR75_11740 [Hyphomonadaceae bacterium BRH_c29]
MAVHRAVQCVRPGHTGIDEFAAREHPRRAARHVCQQAKFGERQRDVLVADTHDMAGRVDFDWSDAQHAAGF